MNYRHRGSRSAIAGYGPVFSTRYDAERQLRLLSVAVSTNANMTRGGTVGSAYCASCTDNLTRLVPLGQIGVTSIRSANVGADCGWSPWEETGNYSNVSGLVDSTLASILCVVGSRDNDCKRIHRNIETNDGISIGAELW